MLKSPNSARQEENNSPAVPFHKVFETLPGLILLLSPDLVIEAATDAYLQATLTTRGEVVGKHVFEAFPDNPDGQAASSASHVGASFQQVISSGKPHKMGILQYDIPDPDRPGGFIERYWSTTNTPVLGEQDEVLYIIHETTNVSDEERAKILLEQSRKREQGALAQAEQQRLRLERLLEQAPAAFAMLEGPELVYKVINNAYQQLFPGRQMLHLPLFEALPELRDQPIYEIVQHVITTGETFEGKEVLVPLARYEGQPLEAIYWNFIYQALYDAEGQISGMLIFALDVTDFVEARRQVEKSAESLQALNAELEERVRSRTQALQLAQAETLQQKQQLEELFMQAPAAIMILEGPELVLQLVNPVYQQIFPGRDIQGKPLLQALPEMEGTPIPAVLGNVYRTGETYMANELPLMLARHEGGPLEEIIWSFTYLARRNGEGAIDGVLVYAHEVTGQVAARKSIEATAQQLQLITDSLPVLISYLDRDLKYRFANKAYNSWFDLKEKSILNVPIIDVIGDKAYEEIKIYIERVLAGEKVDYEAAMPYREGLRHVRTTYVPDFRNGQVVGFYSLVMDVSDQVASRRALEESEREAKGTARELEAANKQLTHINADLDNFIYTASHDLKAPISNIEMLMQELLLELPQQSQEQEELNKILGMMGGSISRFKKTIETLTQISRLQKDEPSLAEAVSLEEVIEEVSLDMGQIISKSGAQLEMAIAGCDKIIFSRKNLRSIVYNLLSNAIKYRDPARKLVVKISCREEADLTVLQVSDNGLGLSGEQQSKLFTMFRRFHDHVEGSGVGLYMVKRIVDNAGGRIEVQSTPGVGTAFQVYLKNQYWGR
ncbi:PAS domain-containing protein [Pontibacter diazotrophicus]|uniref:histidine kinase n=1 Tax=Pontibacter diazotrophicus TaxID=1400979 RepID=A0A3D8L3G3_9BACT|nr:PAS domain-containing protein [Pontibacter diazotrophicus]RDV11961.1 PAS domain-containing protein [Pontibacter diazotrophicus]